MPQDETSYLDYLHKERKEICNKFFIVISFAGTNLNYLLIY